MKNQKAVFLLVIIAALTCAQTLFAQQLGYPPFGSFQVGNFDGVNLQDLNVTFSLPVVTSSGRGINFQLPIVYNSLVWTKYSTLWSPSANWGWQTNLPQGQLKGGLTLYRQYKCYNPGPGWFWGHQWTYRGYAYVDPAGTIHSFPISFVIDDCWGDSGTYSGYATDGSGYYGTTDANYNLLVKGPAGTAPAASSIIDSNGNYITQTINGSETDYKDSVGRTAAKVTTGASSITYQFLDGTGTNTYKTATLNLTSTSIKTNFACGVTEYTGSAYLPTELDIPTPSGTTLKYLFSYEPTPGSPATSTGRLQKVTLPTGGTYEYDYGATNDGVSCTDGSVINMTRKVTDGSTVGTWQYARAQGQGNDWLNTVTDAAGNDTVYTFPPTFGGELERQLYSGTGGSRTIQRTINTAWASNGTPATQVSILEDNSTQSEIDTTFDSNGLLDSMTEYDWGAGARGAALRTTTLSYLNTSNYITRNIINRVTSKIVKDGSGTIKYRQAAGYDETALTCITGVAQHDDTDFPCSMNYRGNPTSVTVYLDPVTPAQPLKTSLTYDSFGNVLQRSVSGTQQDQIKFSGATVYANPDSIVVGPSTGTQLTTSYTYFTDTGMLKTVTDPNGQNTSYAYDFLRRLTSVTRPDNSQVTYAYNDSACASACTTDVTTPIDSGRSVQQITAFDKLGLPYTSTIEDSTSTVHSIVQTNYDAMGRPYRTSNPYTGSPSNWTMTSFDALSRPYQVKLQDNSTLGYSYATTTMTATDPAGKARKSVFDGAGRLAKVFEPDVTNGNSLTVETDYSYTVLNSPSTVTQGVQTRTNSYDALGRLASVATPEAGTTCFGTYSGSTCQKNGYDNFGNLVSRTDVRGVVTNYAYDSLNRLIGVSYGQPLPSGVSAMPNTICNPVSGSANSNVCFYYDQGGASAYALGRQTKRVDASGSETYTYNNLGESTQLQKVIGGNTYPLQYAYNTAGELLQTTYPSGHSVYESYDAIGRLCEVAASSIGSACGSTTTPYLNGFAYNTANELTAANYANGVDAAFGFSSDRLQLSSLSYTKTGTTLFGLTYAYGSGLTNDGQIAGITDTVQAGRTATYTYDAMGRLSTAVTVGSTAYPKWGLSFSYDRYGNRTSESSTAGNPPTNSLSFANPGGAQTNHPDNYTFDAGGIGGNMTNDGYNTLNYDGENRLTSMTSPSASATYSFDSTGLRVQKSVQNGTTTVYVYSGRRVIAEYENGALPANPTREYVYSGSALVAKIEGGATIYYHGDHLSTRLMTDSSGNLFSEQGHYPFGEACYSHNTTTKWEFTTYERDAETDPPPHYGDGNDYAEARSYVNRLARFYSTDPVEGSSSDPQTLNRYAYVENDPINLADPTGLCPIWGPVIEIISALDAPNFVGHLGYDAADGTYQTCRATEFSGVGDFEEIGMVDSNGCGPEGGCDWPFLVVALPPINIGQQDSPIYGPGRDLASKVLSGNNDCANFFNSATYVNAGITDLGAPGFTAQQALASDRFIPVDNLPLLTGAATTEGASVGPGSIIQINAAENGAFLSNRGYGLAGVFTTGSLAGQTLQVLHEIAHTLLLIPGDLSNAVVSVPGGQSEINSATIAQKCALAILAAVGGVI